MRIIRLLSRKTPITNRSFRGALLVLLLASGATAETLTEATVIQRAKTLDANALAARASAAVAETEEVRAGLYPNPSLSWEREQVTGTLREREDNVLLTVPIEVTGRRPAEKALARVSAATARARAARTQSEAVMISLKQFYEVIAAERELEIMKQTVSELDAAAKVVARRHAEGTTSGYERMRLEIETELARSQLEEAAARARSARATLAALLSVDAAALQLRGSFITVEPETETPRRPPPSLMFLRTAEANAADARSSAGWAWLPTLEVSGGFRVLEQLETRTGYVAGVSVSLPIFSRGQELRAEASARQRLAAAEVKAEERALRVNEVRAREELASARREIARFIAVTGDRVEVLERAVHSGYREGDRSVLELVDVERVRAQVQRRLLELELVAKRAEIELRAARGEFE